MSQKNTLFNYFSKSPAPALKLNSTPGSESSPSQKQKGSSTKTPNSSKVSNGKTPKSQKKGTTNGDFKSPTAKKRLIAEVREDDLDESMELENEDPLKDLEDSADDYVPDEADHESDEAFSDDEQVYSDEPSSPQDDDDDSPVKGKKRKRIKTPGGSRPNKKCAVSNGRSVMKSVTRTPSSSNKNKSNASSQDMLSSATSSVVDNSSWPHIKLDFLQPEKIRDAKRRRPDHSDYDPRTLHVPEDYLRSLTPAMRQWWELKAKNFDCILFFKLGKFYELYHMDAVISVNELSLTFMKGDFAHCGFPEIAYGRFSAKLVDKGYKVARVEQMETPEMMAERVKKIPKPTKFDKVVSREICQLTTKGTRVFTVADGEAREAHCSYLLAIVEKEIDRTRSTYGVCFVDTSMGTFFIGQFDDDRFSSRLRTLIANYPPVQVLHERNRLSKRTNQILNTAVASSLKEALTPETEFWSSTDTLKRLLERKYFPDGELPEPLKSFVGGEDSLGLIASCDSELGIRALGAITWFLKRGLLDFQLLSMGRFEVYKPLVMDLPNDSERPARIMSKSMILDAITLRNLNILDNGCGGLQGSLLHRIDNCCTPFGKRLLRHWLCSPSTSITAIRERQKAIKILMGNPSLLNSIGNILVKVPDLERLFSRIYAQSSKGLEESHPDNRAVMFEEKKYSKRKIVEFIAVLNGFEQLQEVARQFQECEDCEDSEILVQCSHFPTMAKPGRFPDLLEPLNYFKGAFDHEQAEKEGRIIPRSGVDPDYDGAVDALEEIEKELKQYLKQQCDHFGCKVQFVGKDKHRFQLEVPDSAAKRANSHYTLVGQRKGFKKYATVETRKFLERQMTAEEARISALQDQSKRIFSKFSEWDSDWFAAIESVATLDVLMSLAKYALSVESDTCTPDFVDECSKPFVDLVNGKYPCLTGEDNFIPNDTKVGGSEAPIILLTGPNMGGKSTLMRQLGLLVILAQMGSIVPAESMTLSPVDRIFTRIGAQDDIMSGDSTFYVELCETAAILNNASTHSLVLVDELGRGTSTFDGTAIAAAVLNEIIRIGSRTIFSTHYHTLVGSFKENQNVALAHMSCMVESEEDGGNEETVTFLYKVAPGNCPKSYGFNAARLAGVPVAITRVGSERAKTLEQEAINRKRFRELFTSSQPRELLVQF